jgi:[acyl-carrier-protein] S-malonyltransferase
MKRGILFPGYGSQFVGMGKELYDTERIMQEYFEEAADCMGTNYVRLSFASSDMELQNALNASLTLFLVGAASGKLIKAAHVPIMEVAGIDIVGWMSALHTAGVISFPDGLYLLRKWIELFEQCLDERKLMGLSIVTLDTNVRGSVNSFVEQMTHRGLFVGVSSMTPYEILILGDEEGIAKIQEALAQEEHGGLTTTPWNPRVGIYGPLPQECVATMIQYLEKIDIKEPEFPVVDIITGELLTTAAMIKIKIQELLTRPLRLDRVYSAVAAWDECYIAIPGIAIGKVVSELMPDKKVRLIETVAEYADIVKEFAPKEPVVDTDNLSSETDTQTDIPIEEKSTHE